mgnify:CR=1 FL=1
MKNCKHVVPILGAFCLMASLSFMPKEAWAESSLAPISQQQGSYQLTGTILDGMGEPVIGANVLVKGTTNGVVTDLNGKFSLQVKPNDILQISYIGYNSQEVAVKGQHTLNITLKEDVESLDEVVVVGYGTMKKKDLTGSVSSVKADELTAFTVANPVQALQGRVPGVVLSQNTGDPSGDYSIRIRGVNSIKGDNSPLYIIDGIPASTASINTYDIESMEILKDASATAIYGSRGANGVVMITTKKGKSGKAKVSYDFEYGFQKQIKKLDLMDAQEWARFYNEYLVNAEILETAPVCFYYCGSADADRVERAFRKAFAGLPNTQRHAVPKTKVQMEPEGPVRRFHDNLDVNQGKLILGFRTGGGFQDVSTVAKGLLFNAIFGGTTNSKLFLHVREKLSLCYFANSSLAQNKGLLQVYSGVEFSNFQKAAEEILAQLSACQKGEISPDELEAARRSVVGSLRTTLDAQGRLEEYWLNRAVSGTRFAPEELAEAVSHFQGENVTLTVRRNGAETQVKIKPVKGTDGSSKLGVWVRDDTQGIGTVTYMDLNGKFGALGHGISDSDTGELVETSGGNLYDTQILGIEKGKIGTPGMLSGVIYYGPKSEIGTVTENTDYGIFGTVSQTFLKEHRTASMEAARRQEVKTGPALVRTSISGQVKDYSVEIQRIDMTGNKKNKSLVIKITDPELLNLTGGIIQGTSGSPVIQNGKIIGAITHVFVQDPTRGYGY